MEAGEKCKNCGASAVVEDEGQVVCTNCGQVKEDSVAYVRDGDYFEHTQSCHSEGSFKPTFGKPDFRLANSTNYFRSALNQWTKYIQTLCERMQIANKEMHTEAVDFFKRAFQITHFKQMHKEGKKATCASCLYITCRLHDWPIMIINLVTVTDIPRDLLLSINMQLIRALKIDIQTVSIEEYVPTCLREHGVSDDRWKAKTLEVISLAKELWLNAGRRVDALVLASCCIAWQASAPANHKLSMKEFGRSMLNQRVPELVKIRYRELTNILRKMVVKVPWVSKIILKKSTRSWMYFLDDILRFKNSLLSHLEPPEDMDDLENQENSFIVMPPSYAASLENRKFENQHVEESNFMRTSGHESRESMYDPELNEKDIPESELSHYIKTPKEIQLVKDLAVISGIDV
ncbi:transcription factor IIIB 50 kDa subunit-like [Lytechinus pictus]|uniref:transcription factor IIIB 50 kDa subunit-like n=1 Tax=Lytechinus pictus TaxID=7653 RepID=UPI0030B9B378